MRWRKAAILGVGLLGGSLGMALRHRGLAGEVWGFARREATVAEGVEVGAIDRGTLDVADAVRGADLVVLCAPVAQMEPMAAAMIPSLARDAWVTDVGSVKDSVVAAVEGMVQSAGAWFVGSHPMAGSDRTGVRAGRRDLFEGAVSVVTPTSRSRASVVDGVEALWTGVGARVMRMSPVQHDEWVSRTSHLPHLMAAVLARYVLGPEMPAEQGALCATGFKDTTRVASGSPEMWRDIVLGNRSALLQAMSGFEMEFRRLREAIERSDGRGVEELLRGAKELRDAWGTTGGRAPGE